MDIYQQYQDLKNSNPKIRARNAAEELNISEGELIASCVGKNVNALELNLEGILKDLEQVGVVMALTRNESCVHERHGVYKGAEIIKMGKMHMGLLANPDIDLRLFLGQWQYGFSVMEGTDDNKRHSLQFFDKAGDAVHKVYMTKKTNADEFYKLQAKYKARLQNTTIQVTDYPDVEYADDNAVDWQKFRKEWTQIKDLHDFYPLLKKYKLGRQQAYKHIGTDYAWQVANDSPRKILELARDLSCEIMVFVGNRGALQIHTGNVNKLVDMHGWYNVLDPEFNLHLKEENIAGVWVIKRPSDDGDIHAVELFDKNEESIATLFGKRKPGIPELELWRELLKNFPSPHK